MDFGKSAEHRHCAVPFARGGGPRAVPDAARAVPSWQGGVPCRLPQCMSWSFAGSRRRRAESRTARRAVHGWGQNAERMKRGWEPLFISRRGPEDPLGTGAPPATTCEAPPEPAPPPACTARNCPAQHSTGIRTERRHRPVGRWACSGRPLYICRYVCMYVSISPGSACFFT